MNNPALAIMFATVHGGTRFQEAAGSLSARARSADCLRALTAVVERHEGTIIKTMGDELMCTFPAAERAVLAAGEMQEAVEGEVVEQPPERGGSLAIRIGLHFGSAIVEGGDTFGDAVNVAARMGALAKTGQIITTQAAVDALSPLSRANTRFLDHVQIKGKKDTMDIYEVLWKPADITRMSFAVSTLTLDLQSSAKLRFSYGPKTILMDRERSQVVLGRSKTADLSLTEPLASRLHAKVEQRRGRYVITDQSTNGTYVKTGRGEAYLRREEMRLTGSGLISAGRSFSDQPSDVVYYSIEF